jgi:hypothetical protein
VQRYRTHVAATLDVVLTAQRIQAGTVATDVAAQEGEVDERVHVVDRVVVLGDAERPADDRLAGAAVGVGASAGTPVRRSPSSTV